jgi:hypothetical protein
VIAEVVIKEHDNDNGGETRTDRIARQAQEAGEATARRAAAARRRGEAACIRVPELGEWGRHSPCRPSEAANPRGKRSYRSSDRGQASISGLQAAATPHEDAATARDRAAQAAAREGDVTRAIGHRPAGARDRRAGCDDLARSQQTTSPRRRYGSVCDTG